MNRSDLIGIMAEKAGITKTAAAAALNAFTDAVVEAVAKEEAVSLLGFGAFRPRRRAARKGFNPATGEAIKIPAKTVMQFSASKAVIERLNASGHKDKKK